MKASNPVSLSLLVSAFLNYYCATLSLQYNLVILALLAFEVTIYRHQELKRLRCNKVPPPTRTLFHDITRRHLDDGMLNCIKYFLNYFFYKFGLEVRQFLEKKKSSISQIHLRSFSSDLLPAGRECHWSENGHLCRWPRLWPNRRPITSQQEVHGLHVA